MKQNEFILRSKYLTILKNPSAPMSTKRWDMNEEACNRGFEHIHYSLSHTEKGINYLL